VRSVEFVQDAALAQMAAAGSDIGVLTAGSCVEPSRRAVEQDHARAGHWPTRLESCVFAESPQCDGMVFKWARPLEPAAKHFEKRQSADRVGYISMSTTWIQRIIDAARVSAVGNGPTIAGNAVDDRSGDQGLRRQLEQLPASGTRPDSAQRDAQAAGSWRSRMAPKSGSCGCAPRDR
jgi:hypothetical protein